MRKQIDRAAGLATLEATEPPSWQDVAVGQYERSWLVRHAELRMDLRSDHGVDRAANFLRGYLRERAPGGRQRDDATFRLYMSGDLVLVRTCAYCATGHFESPQIDEFPDF
jgi:hypothetical protein